MLKLEDGKYFKYETIGEFRTDAEWIHPARIIDSYELIFVLEGCVCLEEDGTEYELHPNELIILEPNTIHSGSRISHTPTAFYWFHFYTDINIPCKVFCGNEYYDIKYLLKKLLHLSNTPSYSAVSADAAGLLILQELICQSRSSSDKSRALINKIAEYVRINIKNNVSVLQTAKHFGYNPDYLGKLFKQSFNIGLREYIASEKIKLIKDMLLTTEMSVKQIAGELGFESENLLIKFYKYHEDISPTKFRNKYYNTHMNNK